MSRKPISEEAKTRRNEWYRAYYQRSKNDPEFIAARAESSRKSKAAKYARNPSLFLEEEAKREARKLERARKKAQIKKALSSEAILLAGARNRSRRRNEVCELTRIDICVPETCPVLGLPLARNKGVWKANSPTLDRINNAAGYTKDNIEVMSYRANTLKKDATLDELILLGEWATRMKARRAV